jgi:hypothetical protein
MIPRRAKSKAGRSPAKKNRPASLANDPMAAPHHNGSPAGRHGSRGSEATMTKKRQPEAPAAAPQPGYKIKRRGKFWEVLDSAGELVCMTVYKRGAVEVVRRLSLP